MAARALYIVSAKRTPFGAFGGKLRQMSATDLAVHSSKAAIAAANIDPKVSFGSSTVVDFSDHNGVLMF